MIKRVLFTIIGAFAALSVGAAGAYFAAQVQVADSVIRAGSVAISTVPTTAPLAIDALAPGTSAVRSLAVINDGSLPSDLVVTSSKKAGITEFYDALAARVSCSGTEVYSGPLATLRTTPLRLAPGPRATFALRSACLPRRPMRSPATTRGSRSMWMLSRHTSVGETGQRHRVRPRAGSGCGPALPRIVGLGAGARCRQVDESGAATRRPGRRQEGRPSSRRQHRPRPDGRARRGSSSSGRSRGRRVADDARRRQSGR